MNEIDINQNIRSITCGKYTNSHENEIKERRMKSTIKTEQK